MFVFSVRASEAVTEDRAPRPSGFSPSCSSARRGGGTEPGAHVVNGAVVRRADAQAVCAA